MKFKELRDVLSSGEILVLKFNDTQTAAQASSDCDEVLRGVENYEVLNIKPHGYELHVLLDRPKEVKK